MRSTSVTKMVKPPPPIPPRPSKALVAESLAKLRKSPTNTKTNENVENSVEIPLSPSRSAPPPPNFEEIHSKDIHSNDKINNVLPICKSQSHSTVNLIDRKVPKLQRSTSHTEQEYKESSRPVIFRSSNLKSHINIKLDRSDSDCSQRNLLRNNSNFSNTCRNEGLNRITEPDLKQSQLITSEPSTDNLCSSKKNNNFRTEFQLNDRFSEKNHVNTLIDEMFASIIDNSDKSIDVKEAVNENVIIGQFSVLAPNEEMSNFSDKTKIISNNGTVDCTAEEIHSNLLNQRENNENVSDRSSNAPVPSINEDNINGEDIIDIEDFERHRNNLIDTDRSDKHVKFDDKKNHELLISELENMRRDQNRILKRQRKPSQLFGDNDDVSKIHHSDWLEVNDGKEVRLSSCQIIIEDGFNNNNNNNYNDTDNPIETLVDPVLSRLKMSSLHGLPPLPKSLSGFNLLENQRIPQTPNRGIPVRSSTPSTPGFLFGQVVYPPHPRTTNGTSPSTVTGRKSTNLDNQLAILRREMVSSFISNVNLLHNYSFVHF